jgi:hypothetical protein
MDVRRRVLAIAWLLLVCAAIGGWFASESAVRFGLITGAWFAGLFLLLCTSALARLGADERLERALAYRVVAGVAFALPLAGLLLTRVPHAADDTYLMAPYFFVMALLGYRVMVARGPRRIVRAMVAAELVWLPLIVVLGMGCKCGPHVEPSWTEGATYRLLFAIQLVDAALIAIALLAFKPRTEWLPEARVTRAPPCSP